MSSNISVLEPKLVWKHFYALTQIPRPSGHEGAVIDHVRQFAISHNLKHEVDKTGNILVRKAATRGMESSKYVVLQAHVDMVPQKNSDKKHDFTKDPIKAIIKGDWVKADNTTLGADNGMGVAAALAVLESKNIKHGPLEVILTVSEETNMDGAFGLSPHLLQSDILLNLDSEEEGELFMGCAGGIDVDVEWTYAMEKMSGTKAFYLKLRGLKGGHSGIDIHLGRANANKVLLQLLLLLQEHCDARIVNFSGGNMRNAIPREADAMLIIPAEKAEMFKQTVDEYSQSSVSKFSNTDPDFSLSWSDANSNDEVLNLDDQQHILNALNSCENGVVNMSKVIPGVVQTSTNLSIVTIGKGRGKAQLLLRSSDDKEKQKLAEQMKGFFNISGAEVKLSGEYPGWQPNADSDALAKAKSTYVGLFGKEPEVKVIHAGLECGIIGSKYPAMDMISFGPTIQFPHSPDEKVHIASVERFWRFLIKLLENI
jgi:dipeptidase D